MVHMLKETFLLQGLNNRLSALAHFIQTEAKGLRTVLDRCLIQLSWRMEQGKAWFVVVWGSCKGHAVPAALAGAAQLQAYFISSCWNKAFVLHHRSPLESSIHGEPGEYSNVPLPSLRSFHCQESNLDCTLVAIFDYWYVPLLMAGYKQYSTVQEVGGLGSLSWSLSDPLKPLGGL